MAGELTESQDEELLAIAHSKVKEAINRTELTVEKVDSCLKKLSESPFDVNGVKTKATTQDILEAVKESRAREYLKSDPKR